MLRLLLRERRFDVATLQRLRGAGDLDQALLAAGLGAPEIERYRAALRRGSEPGLGHIAGYELVARLGQGGMGAVYGAVHSVTGARRAIKVVHSLQPEALERFRREGVAQAQVDGHPNVLRVFGAGHEGGKAFLVMEIAEGGDLASRLAEGPMAPAEAAELIAQLADGLQHVHDHGILHRDLKPANVLFTASGRPLLVDFGVAQLLDVETLTRTHMLVGTPAYMAPEQVRALREEIGPRTDVYALGAILYECLTGGYMFADAGGGLEVLTMVLEREPQPPDEARPEVPAWLSLVCMKALAKDPEERFASAEAFAVALRAGRPVAAVGGGRSLRRAAALTSALVAVALGTGWVLRAPWAGTSGEPPSAAQVAALATRIHAGLYAARPLQDASEAADLRAELQRLEAAGAAGRLRVARAELLTWEGLLAHAEGRDADAQLAELARLEQAGELPLAAEVLRGLVKAQVTPETLAQSGLRRPELAGWRDQALARRAAESIELPDLAQALQLAEQIQAIDQLGDEARGRMLRGARRLLERYLVWLRGVKAYAKEAPDKPNFKAYRLLRLLHLLDPVNGVTGPEIDALLEFGLSRTRTVFWTAPRAAAFRPQDTELQVRVARHFVFLDDTTRPDRKLVAEGYLPFVERAYRGSPPGAVKWEMAALLGHVLRVAERYEEGVQRITQLLEGQAGLPAESRARLLAARGECWRLRGDHQRALADFDASLAESPLPLVRFRKAWALLRGPTPTQDQDELARREALAALRGIDLRHAGVSREERLAYPLAAVVVWRATLRLEAGFDQALEAIDRLLASTNQRAPYAGWLVRRAYVRLRCSPPQREGALADLQEALSSSGEKGPLSDLRKRSTRAIASVRAGGARSLRQVRALCDRLDRKRGVERGLP